MKHGIDDYLYEKLIQADQNALDHYFTEACSRGDLNVVKFLLASPELKNHANIHTSNDLGIYFACKIKDKELVNYLLSSEDIKENITAEIAINKAYFYRDNSIINFLIYEVKIPKNNSMDLYLHQNYYNPFYKEISKMFSIRDLNEELTHDLSSVNTCKERKNKL
jgi:hypothetical protein